MTDGLGENDGGGKSGSLQGARQWLVEIWGQGRRESCSPLFACYGLFVAKVKPVSRDAVPSSQ